MQIIENEPLYKHSTFRIGGNANVAYFPENKEEFCNLISSLKEKNERYIVVGNGSNILFDDEGYDGAVIFTKSLKNVEYIRKGETVTIKSECGKMLSELSFEACRKHALTGLEFAYGIPGTVGGAVYMNAGAYGGEISYVLTSSEVYDVQNGKIITLSKEDHKLSYRHSVFFENKDFILLNSSFELHIGGIELISKSMENNMNSRREKQPLEYPSAGSAFKRPEGYFAAKLIDDAGLKGLNVGGASVSEKHAGFIINKGNAKSIDVLELIKKIQDEVYNKYSVLLTPEIIHVKYKEE